MVVFLDAQRFELTVEVHYDEWVARLQEFTPGRLVPILHLLRAFDTRQAAIEALTRKWHLLFPEAESFVWHKPPAMRPQRPPR